MVLDGVTLKHREMRTLHVDKADYLSSFWASDGVPHKISFGFDSASWNVIVYVDGVQIGKIVNYFFDKSAKAVTFGQINTKITAIKLC